MVPKSKIQLTFSFLSKYHAIIINVKKYFISISYNGNETKFIKILVKMLTGANQELTQAINDIFVKEKEKPCYY